MRLNDAILELPLLVFKLIAPLLCLALVIFFEISEVQIEWLAQD